jgi:hypothetical protein
MSEPGREDIAEVSRLSRAIATRRAGLPPDEDPLTDELLVGLLEETATLPVPARSLQYMSAIVVAMYKRLVRVARQQGASPVPIEELLLAQGGGNVILLKDCRAVVREIGRPQPDQKALEEAVWLAAERWGQKAVLALSFMFQTVALNVLAHDPSVSTMDELLAQFFLDDEVDLINKGEA